MDDIFNKISNLKILIVGDIILDKFYFTDVIRLSQEAPIPVAKFNSQEGILGASANIALNLRKLGCTVNLIGKIGVDEDGVLIRKLLNEQEINFMPIFSASKTLTKIRIFSKNYNIFRLDFENDIKTGKKFSDEVIEEVSRLISNVDLVIVADYKKGLITKNIIDYLKEKNKYVVIDTVIEDVTDFSKFALFKTNFERAIKSANRLGFYENFTNTDESVEKLGFFLRSKINCDILITRSEMGSSYFSDKVYHVHVKNPVFAKDITGSGDTTTAYSSVLNYIDLEKRKSLQILNAAGRVVNSHIGTYAPEIFEIKEELDNGIAKNYISHDKIVMIREKLKIENKKVILTYGTFEEISYGEVKFLCDVKKLGEILILILESKKLKFWQNKNSRAFILNNLKPVNFVVFCENKKLTDLIKMIKPDVFAIKKGNIKNIKTVFEQVKSYGGIIKII